MVCALGTTRAKAGSAEAFREMDYGLPLAFARAAKRSGVERFALTSSKGAAASSTFLYLKVKGELERDLQQIGFKSLTIVRPGFIGGNRAEKRPAEALMSRLLGTLAPLLPRSWRISRSTKIAEALVEGIVASRPGVRIVEATALC